MANARFTVGQRVNHPACPNGTFPAGSGTIQAVNADGTYAVKCDKTGQILNHNFKESDLSAA